MSRPQTEAFAEFSSFAPCGVAMKEPLWRTVEHHFQAMKVHDAAWREKIRSCGTPKRARAPGVTRALPLRADWERVKDELMLAAVRVTFATRPVPRAPLLSTGGARIVGNAPMDDFWG